MNTSFTCKQIGWSAACALTLSFAFSAQAADFGPGASIWRNAAGEWCWNRAFAPMPPPGGCGVLLVDKNVTPALAPVFVAPASAPAIVAAPNPAAVQTK